MSASIDEPSQFGRYVVKRLLGEGQMGRVYLAEDPMIGRRVAIKVIRDGLVSGPGAIDEAQDRFEREIRVTGTFSHPGIVAVHDVGLQGGALFIVMEYVENGSLEQILAGGRKLSVDRVVGLIARVGSALDYSHAHDVVHRDVKPANILLTAAGDPKLTDFGVARLVGSTLTRRGTTYGSPAYMSPEQAAGEELDGASDQFSLGIIAYQALTGQLPFTGDSVTAVVFGILNNDPPPPELLNPTLPGEAGDVLMRALVKSPAGRHPSCQAFGEALESALRTPAAVPSAVERSQAPAGTVQYAPAERERPAGRHLHEAPRYRRLWASLAGEWVGLRSRLILLVVALAAVLAGGRAMFGGRPAAPGADADSARAASASIGAAAADGQRGSPQHGGSQPGWTLAAPGRVPAKLEERARNAAHVLEEIMGTPERSIPSSLLAEARCVGVIPGVKKVGFGFGGRYGRGLVSCRSAGGWSRPSFVSLTGGSFGLQIGAQSTDFVLVFANEQAARRLLERRFTMGADASVSAGPVGRTAEAGTDVKLQTEIYSYSRSRGLFAGVALEGASVANDEDANKNVYGRAVGPEDLLSAGGGELPPELAVFVRNLERFASSGH